MRGYFGSICACLFGAVTIATSSLSAQTIDSLLPDSKAPCAGELGKRHAGDFPWDFSKNSRRPNRQSPTTYLHCVFNHASRDVLEVHWLVPSLQGVIPAGNNIISPRYSSRGPTGSPDGCLIYGNLRNKSLRAQFWARPEDEGEIKSETGKNCLGPRPSTAVRSEIGGGKTWDIVAPFRVFISSKPGSPDAALIAFEGITGVRSFSEDTYETYLNYRLRAESDSLVRQIKGEYALVPRWIGPVEVLATTFRQVNKVPTVIDTPDGVINFKVTGSLNWVLDELVFELRDKRGQLWAAVVAPVFLPMRQ